MLVLTQVLSLTPAPSKVAMPVNRATAARTTESAICGAAALAQAHTDIEQRLHAEVREQGAMRVLGRAVPEDAVIENLRLDARGERGGDRHGEPIDDDQVSARCSAHHRSHQHRDLVTAEFREQFDRILRRRPAPEC